MKKNIVLAATVLLFGLKAVSQVKKHWNIVHANEIALDLSKEEYIPYSDNIEMAGKRVAGIISYEINEDKELSISREIFFPQLRTYIKTNDAEWKHYRAYFKDIYSDAILPSIIQNNKIYAPGKVSKVHINGMLQFVHEPVGGVALTRTFFPSMSERLFVEQWTLTNTSE